MMSTTAFRKSVSLLRKSVVLLLAAGGLLCATEIPGYAARNPVDYYLGIPTSELRADGNPAWLMHSEYPNHLRYAVDYVNQSGSLKLPFEPQRLSQSIASVSGNKMISQRGVFAGNFSYRNYLLSDKMWVHNGAPYTGNPFLLADSSVGDVSLNGLFWELNYAHALIPEKLDWGVSVFYNVDESVKQTFPKPIVHNRDLTLSSGLGYTFSSRIRTGLTLNYFDFQEIMKTGKYSLDQDKTPVFFKIRGLDNPIILHGVTSEERLLALQGVRLTLDATLNQILARLIRVSAGMESARACNEDGGSYPIAQGDWFIQKYFYKLDILLPVHPKLGLDIHSTGNLNQQQGDHPDFNAEIYEFRTQMLGGGFDLVYQFAPDGSVSPGWHFTSQTYKRIDKFNGILQYVPSSILGYHITSSLPGLGRLSAVLGVGLETLTIGDPETFLALNGFYYDAISKAEAEYLAADKSELWLQATLTWKSAAGTHYALESRWSRIQATGADLSDKDRNFLSLKLTIDQFPTSH